VPCALALGEVRVASGAGGALYTYVFVISWSSPGKQAGGEAASGSVGPSVWDGFGVNSGGALSTYLVWFRVVHQHRSAVVVTRPTTVIIMASGGSGAGAGLPVPGLPAKGPGAVLVLRPIGRVWYTSTRSVLAGSGHNYTLEVLARLPEGANVSSVNIDFGGLVAAGCIGGNCSVVDRDPHIDAMSPRYRFNTTTSVLRLNLSIWAGWSTNGSYLVTAEIKYIRLDNTTGTLSARLLISFINETVAYAPGHLDVVTRDNVSYGVVRAYVLYRNTAIPVQDNVTVKVYDAETGNLVYNATLVPGVNGVVEARFKLPSNWRNHGYRVVIDPEHGDPVMFQAVLGRAGLVFGGHASQPPRWLELIAPLALIALILPAARRAARTR